ncbi:MAG: serine/threonine protein kinase [Bradymonadia bacterium]|jgi:serine/threonine protein kinase
MKAQFGRYVFLKKLAVGGMAEIFLARRLSFGGFAKFVVLKRLLPEHRGRRAYERLFLTEARITALLDHPNVISLHDLGKLDGAYFMAMEYVHGVSAAELMGAAARARNPIPLGVALRVIQCVAEGLHYCVEKPDVDGRLLGILHHDISPHNIQVSFDGAAKLLDFGVATQMDRPFPAGRRGKFAYMSPEALNKMDLDPRSDLFSLGVCLYELTVGRRLFKGASVEETRAKSEAGTYRTPTEVRPDFPPMLEAIVIKALERDPDQRYQDAQTLIFDLENAARALRADTSVEATLRYFKDLYGTEIDRRRHELHALAVASMPRRKAPPTEASVAELEVSPPPLPAAPAQADDERPTEVMQIPAELSASYAALNGPDSGPAKMPTASADDAPAEADVGKEADEADVDAEGELVASRPADAASDDYAEPDASENFLLPVGVNDDDDEDWDEMMGAAASSWRRWILLTIFLGLAGSAGAFFAGQLYEEKRVKAVEVGTLRIESEPTAGKVYDGDKLLGTTPFEARDVPVGTVFRLRVERLGFQKWRGKVTVTKRQLHRTIMVGLRKK